MKKIICAMLCIVLLFGVAVPALAATPVITSHPSSVTCKEGEYIEFMVSATGDSIWCRWFLEIDNVAYDLSNDISAYPWIDEVGYDHGAFDIDGTYYYFFVSATLALDGAKIYAVFNDNDKFAESNKATISVTPALDVRVPAYLEVYQGDVVDIYCSATDMWGGTLSYIWYSSPTNNMADMIAINRGTETSDTLRVNTDTVGTTFYCCLVSSSSELSAYSPITRVTVLDRSYSEVDPPQILTTSLPNATAGKPYYFKLDCTDGDATFTVYYNPGKENSFDATGLNLTAHGELEGTPSKAGTYSFTVCATGEGGEDYTVVSLTVEEPAATTAATTAKPETTPPATTSVSVSENTTAATKVSFPENTTAATNVSVPESTPSATDTTAATSKESSTPATSSPITLESNTSEIESKPVTDSPSSDIVPTIGQLDEESEKISIGLKILIVVLVLFATLATAAVVVLVVLLIVKRKK